MIASLYRPASPLQSVLIAAGIVLGVALYCLGYTALTGERESPLDAVTWAVVNILPFYVAFEMVKRVQGLWAIAGVLAAALLVSLALHAAIEGPIDLPFQLLRRMPAIGLALFLPFVGREMAAARDAGPGRRAGDLPLPPREIDRVAAAGNYVELHAGKRVVLHRAPISVVAEQLARHGFIRIHRSHLVAGRAIARRRRNDVVLHDGTCIKTGKRYRAALDGLSA